MNFSLYKLLAFTCLINCLSYSYGQDLFHITQLKPQLNECSGMVYVNSRLITLMDSGNENKLFEIDTTNGNIKREVFIANATNNDWEDICYDNDHIFIGDFGNNSGSRTDLKIYKISIADYISYDTVWADSICFSYSDQVDFTPSSYSTNFDAEALISFNDSLYIFTKNWGDYKSNIYSLPKNPGTYNINKVASINPQSLVTAAHYDSLENRIILQTYTLFNTTIILLDNFFGDFSNINTQYFILNIPSSHSKQFESVCTYKPNKYFVCSEESNSLTPNLYCYDLTYLSLSQTISKNISVFPNPSNSLIKIDYHNIKRVDIYDNNLNFLYSYYSNIIDISKFANGIYYLRIFDTDGITYNKKIIKI